MKTRISQLTALVATLVLLAALAIGASPSTAKIIHQNEGAFNGADAPSGPLGGILSSDAVDNSGGLSAGDVYILESNIFGLGKGIVFKFDAKGKYDGVEIKGSATPQGSFAFTVGSGLAVDSSASNKGDVYVADTEHGVVDRFSESGKFLCQITGKKPATTEEKEHECNGAAGSEPTGGPAGLEPAGLAVESATGDLYVADNAHAVIDKFGPSGGYISQIADSHLTNHMTSIALDDSGDLYVDAGDLIFSPETLHIIKFHNGSFASVFDSNESRGVGVDPVTGHVYVSESRGIIGEEERKIVEYEPSGEMLSVVQEVPSEHRFVVALAADETTGKIYMTESPLVEATGSVAVFGPGVTVPTATTDPATNIEETSATLHGEADPDATHGGTEATGCRFEYGPTKAYGLTAPCSPGPPYGSPEHVSAEITGLSRSTTYHYRLEAANANKIPSQGQDATFITRGPAVVDSESDYVSGHDVSFKAQIDPYGLDTACQLQYVDEASYRNSRWAGATTLACAPEDIGSGFADREVNVNVNGLEVGVTYHYRFLATNQAGISGREKTFTTFGANSVKFEIVNEEGEGHPYTQAGGHPYELRTSFTVNSNALESNKIAYNREPNGNLETVLSDLPVGFVGNPTATPKCTLQQLHTFECSGAAQVGTIGVNIEGYRRSPSEGYEDTDGVYNLVPPKGVAAEFGAHIGTNLNVYIDSRVNSGGDYRVIAESVNNSSIVGIGEVTLTYWGVPDSKRFDSERRCPVPGAVEPSESSPCSANVTAPKPFLRMPTLCSGPLNTTIGFDSWQVPGEYDEHAFELPPVTGCNKLEFKPSVEALPTTSVADSPTGLRFDLHVPQNENPEGLAEADLKDAAVTFPAGLVVNPSSADGLSACSEAQVGFTGFAELDKLSEPGVETAQFTPTPAECPSASKVGSVAVDTPLVDHPLPGAIYLARQGENPFGSLLAVYIAVYDPVTGVVVKLAGHVEANPQTGQLSTIVDQSPQLPFEDFKIDLFNGSRASLTTPATCGSFVTGSQLVPWSSPEGATATPSGSFEITQGPNGSACPATASQEPNSPAFSAGTFTPIAGAYSPFVLHLSREDDSQTLRALNVTLPEGLTGKIAGIEKCPQADIEAAEHRNGLGEGGVESAHPSCPASSEIGAAHVGAGSGAPFYVTGHAYFAGPYEGAPFSIVVITPAVAGPFDLGTVVVRSALFIDPNTAQVTVKTDPFPTILDGIPLDIRSIAVEMTRSQFMLNPTSCEKMAVTGTAFAASSQAALSSPFQVGGCNGLVFKPSFSAFTKGKNSRAKGASLIVKLAQKPGEANLHKVDLALPTQLPSRLSTLKLACPAAQFEANPAGCPAASNIGTGKASTPLLSVPFSGPAYLVSHGGAEFPDIEFVLQAVEQGGDIKIVLDGKTQIKNGVTYSHFETVPDAPISSFETVFPQGPYSILGTNVAQSAKFSLCGRALKMGTTLTAQNGVVVTQSTKIQVTGCATVKALTRAQKLTRALKACRKDRNRVKRAACVKAAHKRYGQLKKSKKK
jgi:hypothetical protein